MAEVVVSDSPEATGDLARRMGSNLRPGSVIALVGELGAGKTTFVQALAEALGVIELAQVVSPSYALMNEYPAEGPPLVHIDLFRLDEPDEARALLHLTES